MPRPVGRPPVTRGIYSLDDPIIPPREIVVETTFVAEALMPSQPRHARCQAFLANIADHSIVYFSELLESELWEAGYSIACRELHPGQKKSKVRIDGRTRRRAERLQRELAEAWQETREALRWASIGVGEVAEWVPVMMSFGLASNDAVHAATAAYADVSAMATLDFGFVRVPKEFLTLYVPAERVTACRAERFRLRIG